MKPAALSSFYKSFYTFKANISFLPRPVSQVAKSRVFKAHLGQGGGQVRGEGAVDVRFQLAQVELDQLVILGALVRDQVLPADVHVCMRAWLSMF